LAYFKRRNPKEYVAFHQKSFQQIDYRSLNLS